MTCHLVRSCREVKYSIYQFFQKFRTIATPRKVIQYLSCSVKDVFVQQLQVKIGIVNELATIFNNRNSSSPALNYERGIGGARKPMQLSLLEGSCHVSRYLKVWGRREILNQRFPSRPQSFRNRLIPSLYC